MSWEKTICKAIAKPTVAWAVITAPHNWKTNPLGIIPHIKTIWAEIDKWANEYFEEAE